jgi:Glycerol-3-phosphate dehydrogenase
VVEGVYSAKAALALSKKFQVEMPIVEQINQVLFEGKSPMEAVSDLLLRDKRREYTELIWEK